MGRAQAARPAGPGRGLLARQDLRQHRQFGLLIG
ncbi:MAG: hypothetical protein K0S78_4116, partial [Thermomicrobiales bacterium]|nr:hypothetical protein [Thermomicrobiales bacterium]